MKPSAQNTISVHSISSRWNVDCEKRERSPLANSSQRMHWHRDLHRYVNRVCTRYARMRKARIFASSTSDLAPRRGLTGKGALTCLTCQPPLTFTQDKPLYSTGEVARGMHGCTDRQAYTDMRRHTQTYTDVCRQTYTSTETRTETGTRTHRHAATQIHDYTVPGYTERDSRADTRRSTQGRLCPIACHCHCYYYYYYSLLLLLLFITFTVTREAACARSRADRAPVRRHMEQLDAQAPEPLEQEVPRAVRSSEA